VDELGGEAAPRAPGLDFHGVWTSEGLVPPLAHPAWMSRGENERGLRALAHGGQGDAGGGAPLLSP